MSTSVRACLYHTVYDQVGATIPQSLPKATIMPALVKCTEAAVSVSGVGIASILQQMGHVDMPKGNFGRAMCNHQLPDVDVPVDE